MRSHTMTVRRFNPQPTYGMLPLRVEDGALMVVELVDGRFETLVAQTNDVREAWQIARNTAEVYGARVDVHAPGVVIGPEVAALVRCEVETEHGDGSYACPLKGSPRSHWTFNLAGYHPCNRVPAAA